ncbi:SRPBCC family protein [Kribbella sp. NPDC049174]|uniref:SRPBCC family protein n=1 Tax=Kribbella sp. NPDC049174 TaxID=3364112 RepID=UPI0037157AB9
MKLTHAFDVRLPVEQAWQVLTDLERIAPCVPGVHLTEATDDVYRGGLKIKVGPIAATYEGEARFVERDVEAWTVVWQASGRETRGKGGASATVTMRLEPVGAGTHVAIDTDLSISGRLAQFGRGVIVEISNGLLSQFVTTLENEIAGNRGPVAVTPRAAAPATTNGTAQKVQKKTLTNLAAENWPDDAPVTADDLAGGDSAADDSEHGAVARGFGGGRTDPDGRLDLLRAVALPMAKRVAPVLALLAGAVLLVRRLRR